LIGRCSTACATPPALEESDLKEKQNIHCKML
jgi:hypothetical protein